jgi:NADPH2:quinone reductase
MVDFMRSIVYSVTGASDVLHMAERSVPQPGPGTVRVRVLVSGVNPTDWKTRAGSGKSVATPFLETVPNQDGAGVIDAVGEGVTELAVGQRVWIWESAWERADGTAQDYVVLPARQVVPLPTAASLDLGASLGIPALTAHRCLSVSQIGSSRLAEGSLSGVTILVVGGAGAVGHFAIQLGRWSGATILTTVSSDLKCDLANRAGAHHVINYRTQKVAEVVRDLAPRGIDLVVEVAPIPNADLYPQILGRDASVSIYALGNQENYNFPVQSHFLTNTRFQFVLVYTVSRQHKDEAVVDISAAVADGALLVGSDAGLPLHRFRLEDTAQAHDAVESAAVGKVLIDLLPH